MWYNCRETFSGSRIAFRKWGCVMFLMVVTVCAWRRRGVNININVKVQVKANVKVEVRVKVKDNVNIQI